MNKKYYIADFGKKIMALEDIENVLELISNEAKMLVNADRCSIFIVDAADEILWTKHSDGVGRIVISLNSGIVGESYHTQTPKVVNKPYENARFLSSIDKKSGFKTKNMITVPIFNSKRDVIGIIQLLNKSRGNFKEEDLDTLTFFANYVSGSLELVLMNEN